MKIFLFLLLVFSFLSSDSLFEDAYSNYKAKNYKTALKQFKKLYNEEKDYDAAYILGYMYEHGEGCEVNIKKANYYYKMAAKGLYNKRKEDPETLSSKQHEKILKNIDKYFDKDTSYTIKQYTKSLYNFKAYESNYFLPVSYRIDNGQYNHVGNHDTQKVEIEFQLSLKYDFAQNFLGLNEYYSFAYTQKSFWQAYASSAYFRESNYNPEFLITFPVSNKYVKVFGLSMSHQSNGRGGNSERSWNYISASMYIQTGRLFTELKLWYRLKDKFDYNPDLIDYMGHGYLRFLLPYKSHLAQLVLRNNFNNKYSLELNYSYPVKNSKDLFFYVKYFNGYGESLIDYNHFVNKVGFGVALSR